MCWTVFDSQWAREAVRHCSTADFLPNVGACWTLESIEYLGTNAAGDDVYSVKSADRTDTYTLPQPGADGRIATRCKFGGPPGAAAVGVRLGGGFCLSSEMKVTSPAGQARILYTRPAEGGGQASAAPSDTATKPVVMATTPTGAGDPNAVVCRAPQPIAGGQSGAQVCLHNYDWWKVAMNGKDIAPDGESLIDRPTVKNPRGDGDPDAITCRTPQFLSRGPLVKVCRLNSFWADLTKNNQMVDAYGNVVSRRLSNGYSAPPNDGISVLGGYDSGHVQSGMPLPGTR
jgi:hypothetical protein